MLICGIKASHDGAVALIDGDRLVFSVEAEKIGNGKRFKCLGELLTVPEIFESEGVALSDVDRFVVDGWGTEGREDPWLVPTRVGGEPFDLPVAPYWPDTALLDHGPEGLLKRHIFREYDFTPAKRGYASYHHVANHVMAAYCSSPFAQRGESGLVLAWDGGMYPWVYYVDAEKRKVRGLTSLFPVVGSIFSNACRWFEPFYRPPGDFSGGGDLAIEMSRAEQYEVSIVGKAMAYAALGEVHGSAFPVLEHLMDTVPAPEPYYAPAIGELLARERQRYLPGISDTDLIATLQACIGERLVRSISEVVDRFFPRQSPNLALGGGCALNIKWNSLIRESGLFEEVWVPPFPSDAGAAIGTACCEMFRETGRTALQWDVYSGPRLGSTALPPEWRAEPCDEARLAKIMHDEDEPVVVLSGRAELGPRALGNRSILAPATSDRTKDRLNAIKHREGYRPVAPMCLASRAAEVFAPGISDRYMLFEHRPRPEWAHRIPAVIHLDGTARLQCIDLTANSASARILTHYEKLSGIPVLCNTSANFNGCGFFPDVASAARWGRTRYIWSDGQLYTNPRPVELS